MTYSESHISSTENMQKQIAGQGYVDQGDLGQGYADQGDLGQGYADQGDLGQGYADQGDLGQEYKGQGNAHHLPTLYDTQCNWDEGYTHRCNREPQLSVAVVISLGSLSTGETKVTAAVRFRSVSRL